MFFLCMVKEKSKIQLLIWKGLNDRKYLAYNEKVGIVKGERWRTDASFKLDQNQIKLHREMHLSSRFIKEK